MTNHETEPFTPYEPEPQYDWDYGEEPKKGPNILWGRVAAIGVGLIVAFLVGRASAPEGISETRVRALEGDLEDAQAEIEDLQAELDAAQANALPTETPGLEVGGDGDTTNDEDFNGKTYTVQSGDNLRNIAQQFCGDPTEDDYIAEFNGLSDPSLISPGTVLKIPEDCGQ